MRKSQIKLKDGSSYGVITLMSVAEEPSSNKVKNGIVNARNVINCFNIPEARS